MLVFLFFTIGHNERSYANPATFAGGKLSKDSESTCGRINSKLHVSGQVGIGKCYALAFLS
jgi:hypothetical protein